MISPERRGRVRLALTVAELEEVEVCRAGLTRTFGRPPTLSEAVLWLARRRNTEVLKPPETRPLQRIPVPPMH
jgi:hypothetical protein